MTNQIKTNSSKCLQALLEGRILNRRTVGDMEIAINKDSLHSIISNLRNRRFIPIESIRKSDGTCDYFMLPDEIKNYQNSELREIQQSTLEWAVERDRQHKMIAQFFKFFDRLIKFPPLWTVWDELPFKLDDLGKQINALLGNEKKR